MPDHLYLPAAGQPISWRDHLRAHPLSVTLLVLVTIGAAVIIADSLLLHALLPSLTPIPRWVQATLGALLLLGVGTALLGMTWRPSLMQRHDGRVMARIDSPLAIERLGWLLIVIVSLGMAWAVAHTGPWVLATMLPITWAVLAASRAVSLTLIGRHRRTAPERIAALRVVR
ncbi:hypothetical protein [Tessaracoccus massiliensis]|uniref:hypothetical protein n=1 Tax=Tessaracoccus massiliensis TaxID=1522311 RepID=UPI00058CBADF|nr:hypothetical protein [Tessaracoccus massiliensis]